MSLIFNWEYNSPMLNDEDINKLTSVLASKSDIEEVKHDTADLKELVQGLRIVIE